MNFWNRETEISFFLSALENFASPEQLFYKLASGYFAYIPKGESAEGQTLQSRNALIGQFTEKWCKDFFSPIAQKLGLHAINGVICSEIGLAKDSKADLAFCTTDELEQKPDNIKLLFEIKMSIVNNYKLEDNKVSFVGDYKSHKGTPSILRSDSVLKAIGKAINIRVSQNTTRGIPIIVVGNAPLGKSYSKKVDYLKKAGIIQGFISLYPEPLDSCLKQTNQKGFQTFDNYKSISQFIVDLVRNDFNFFSAMIPKRKLGQIITLASKEKSDLAKAEKFLTLMNQ